MFLQFINHPDNQEDVVMNIGKKIDPYILQELQHCKPIDPNRILANFPLKYPAFMRKRVLLKKIEKIRPGVTIIWDLVVKLPGKPKGSLLIHYDHGCSWRFPDNANTLNYFDKVDGCIAVSFAARRVLELRFNIKKPIALVPNTLPRSYSFCENKTVPGRNNIILGTASRLVSLKGIGVAILTLHELQQRGFNAKLLIAGKGPAEQQLKDLVKKLRLEKSVTFLGYQQDLTSFYQNIHFYLSFPVTESFGLSCLDALYSGTPCIYPIVDGQPEVIKNNIHGVGIIPTLTPEQYQISAGHPIDGPEKIYNPVTDSLDTSKVVDWKKSARVIEDIIVNGSYDIFLDNLKKFNQQDNSPTGFIDKINLFSKETAIKNEKN